MKTIKNYWNLISKRVYSTASILNTLSPAEMGNFVSSNVKQQIRPAEYWWVETND